MNRERERISPPPKSHYRTPRRRRRGLAGVIEGTYGFRSCFRSIRSDCVTAHCKPTPSSQLSTFANTALSPSASIAASEARRGRGEFCASALLLTA